jgi:hypothetical protein
MKFKVGDKVRVKSRSELKELFKKNARVDSDGDWEYEYKLPDGSEDEIYFVSDMKAACGEIAKIVLVDEDYGTYELEFEHDIFSDEDEVYQFIEDWLEPNTDKPIYVSSFDGEEESKSERLKAILAQIEELAAEAREIVEG